MYIIIERHTRILLTNIELLSIIVNVYIPHLLNYKVYKNGDTCIVYHSIYIIPHHFIHTI